MADSRSAIDLSPETEADLLGLARAYLGAGNAAAAKGALGKYLKNDPESEEAQFLFAYALYRQQRFPQAAERLQKLLNRDPTDADALHLMGMTLFFMHRYVNSRKALENDLKLRPEDPETLYFLAGAYYFGGRVPEAIRAYRHVLRLNPLSYQAYDALGLSEQRTGKVSEAALDFKKALQLARERNPKFVAPYTHLTMLLISGQRYAEAAPYAAQAIRMDPSSSANQYLMGSVLFHQGELERALPYLERSVKLDGTFPEPHFCIAQVYQRLGRRGDAAREAEAFRRLSEKRHLPASRRLAPSTL